MKRKNFVLCVVMILAMFVFTGCGTTKDERFTYNWKAYSMTNNGSTVYFRETDPLIPEFFSSDGKTCVFTNNGKPLTGTIKKKTDSLYNIKFETGVSIEAGISEDTLTLSFNSGQVVLVFKAG